MRRYAGSRPHRDEIRAGCRGQPVPLVVTLISKWKSAAPKGSPWMQHAGAAGSPIPICWCLELMAAVDKMSACAMELSGVESRVAGTSTGWSGVTLVGKCTAFSCAFRDDRTAEAPSLTGQSVCCCSCLPAPSTGPIASYPCDAHHRWPQY